MDLQAQNIWGACNGWEWGPFTPISDDVITLITGDFFWRHKNTYSWVHTLKQLSTRK